MKLRVGEEKESDLEFRVRRGQMRARERRGAIEEREVVEFVEEGNRRGGRVRGEDTGGEEKEN